jgi:hypothetical protein
MKKIVAASLVLVGIVLIGLFLSCILLPARNLGYVDSAIGSLRILNNGLHEYATAHPLKGFPETLQDLHTSVLIDETLAWGAKNHYKFSYLPEIPPVNGSRSISDSCPANGWRQRAVFLHGPKWGNSLQRGRTSKPIKLRLVEMPKRILKSILVSYALLSFCSSSVRAGMISKMSPTTP